MIRKLFSKQTIINCDVCKGNFNEEKAFILHMNTSEGSHEIKICEDCAKTLEEMKEGLETWMTR